MEIRLFKNVKGKLTGRLCNVFVVALILSLPLACKDARDSRPEQLLTKEEMVAVLQEIYVTEEKINRLVLPRDSSETVFTLMEEKVFEKYNIPDSTFKQSLDYYMDRPKEMELIYTALVDSLQLKEQRVPARIDAQ